MKYFVAQYVAYLLPGYGGPMPSESVQTIESRDPQQHANDASEKAYAFFYYDVVEVLVEVGNEIVLTRSERRNISDKYFIDAEAMTMDDDSDKLPETVLENMIYNDWNAVVRCNLGNYQPFDPEKDHIILAAT